VKLRDIAHSRTGDKGHLVNLSVIAYDEAAYPRLVRLVTVDRVRAQLAGLAAGDIVRYEVPTLGALNFVVARRLDDSVTRSLRLDAHGKTLSALLLDMDIDD
jgi:hypothetical protein